jgi:ABC-2 type transport system ATP-binding protein
VAAARAAIERLDDVESVRTSGDELTAVVSDGPAAVPGIAVAINEIPGARISQLSFRRPSLDDVFLEVTGARIAAAGDGSGGEHGAGEDRNPETGSAGRVAGATR